MALALGLLPHSLAVLARPGPAVEQNLVTEE